MEDLIHEVYCELDMIRILSKLSTYALRNEFEDLKNGSFELIFEDIEKRCNNISELTEKIDRQSVS